MSATRFGRASRAAVGESRTEQKLAAARLEAALETQARLGDVYARAVGTPVEISAYLRLKDAGRRVARCERLLREARRGALGGTA
jgi:hypothetical protein